MTQKQIQFKCICGSELFYLTESLTWKCMVNENGELDCNNKSNEIEEIVCYKCDRNLPREIVDSIQINFN